ncbi:hypothetical protein BDZ89DRAFT_1069625 [Hymenopellis radicata]|nr:hypothetical protein BDZ89DRAFT_1069625 [Hymenopellis radicata]
MFSGLNASFVVLIHESKLLVIGGNSLHHVLLLCFPAEEHFISRRWTFFSPRPPR